MDFSPELILLNTLAPEAMIVPPLGYLLALIAFVWGSCPTAYLVTKKLKGIDIREHGSGNAGATNVKRVVGNKAALFVLIFDFFKGFVPVVVAKILLPEALFLHVILALLPVLGHSKSMFLNFTGGKGAITGLGGVLALNPVAGILLGVFAFTVIKLTRIVSVGSMLTGVIAPVVFYFFKSPMIYIIYTAVCSLYVIYLHRSNIKRLLAGEENKI